MTPEQLRLARKVEACHRAGVQPTYWRLADFLGATVPAVHQLATVMRRAGLVQPGTPGMVRLSVEGREAVADARDEAVQS
jgi:hypothetical protein